MSKINVLSFEVANLIAAGEVVERPASVLKELIENSIDSGADFIEAEIKKGGVALIRVTDNGCGIEPEDLPIALKRHATSKIKGREDLDSILTLGFRGEALAAISSVSELTIISKTKTAETATMLTSVGGNVVDISEVYASDGTTVVVENLFANVPARRKFLKKDATEAANVRALVEKIALSHPEISIVLRIDGEQKFKTPGDGDLLNTITAVFGVEFSSKLLKVEGVASGIKVFGYVGRSDNVRKNRNMQNFFINGRYVKSMTAMAAIERAFTSYIAPDSFPSCVLFIEMHPGTVDVNVHPAKLEVKFSDEKEVFEAVYYTVKSALEKFEYRPEMELKENANQKRNVLGAFLPVDEKPKVDQIRIPHTEAQSRPYTPSPRSESIGGRPRTEDKPVSFSSGARDGFFSSSASAQNSGSSQMTPKNSLELLRMYGNAQNSQSEEAQSMPPAAENNAEPVLPEYKIVGEAFDCYIMVETEGKLLVIDKHAAHERIIFEDLKSKVQKDAKVYTQKLMLPLTVILSPGEHSAAKEYIQQLNDVGFEYNLNDGAADILSVPSLISISDAEELFVKMLDEIIEGVGNPQITNGVRKEKALYQIACKAAIKGGRVYDKATVEWLVKKVLELSDITVCPHGRPIAYILTKTEIDRQFNRIK